MTREQLGEATGPPRQRRASGRELDLWASPQAGVTSTAIPSSLSGLWEVKLAPSRGACPELSSDPYLLQHVATSVVSREDGGSQGPGGDPVVADRAVVDLELVPKFI